ncbi:MAG: phosphopantetheine adenylyltransferase [Candidatus Tectimicrobiota bacterium]|nr:MAG: phosphopantetheine adenylyltransferase [Candidatus Tectomicrobia bacterium]
MAVAVYPGTFDPITNGHLDLIKRSLRMFDRLIVAIFDNPMKGPLFTVEERRRLVEEATRGLPNLEIDTFNTLLVLYAKQRNADVIIRGLRAIADFEYEFQMTLMNRRLDENIQTVFLMPREEYTYVSSRLIKEVAAYGGDVERLVPPPVAAALKEKFRRP